jgi:hypothetical protein
VSILSPGNKFVENGLMYLNFHGRKEKDVDLFLFNFYALRQTVNLNGTKLITIIVSFVNIPTTKNSYRTTYLISTITKKNLAFSRN